jgi:hypothetical protein
MTSTLAYFVELVLDNCPAQVRSTTPLTFVLGDVEAAVTVGDGRTAITIEVPGLEDFTLKVEHGDAWFDDDLGDPAFDRAHAIATNDLACARWWMDEAARVAVRAAKYTVLAPDRSRKADAALPPRLGMVTKGWVLRLEASRLQLLADDELDGSYVGLMLPHATTLAGRMRRWVDELAELPLRMAAQATLGQRFADAVDGLGRPIELTLTRTPLASAGRGLSLVATSALDTAGGVVLARRGLAGRWAEPLLAELRGASRSPRRVAEQPAPDGFTLLASDQAAPTALTPLVTHPAFVTSPPSVVRLRPGAVDMMWMASDAGRAGLGLAQVRAAVILRTCLGDAGFVGPYR